MFISAVKPVWSTATEMASAVAGYMPALTKWDYTANELLPIGVNIEAGHVMQLSISIDATEAWTLNVVEGTDIDVIGKLNDGYKLKKSGSTYWSAIVIKMNSVLTAGDTRTLKIEA